MGSGGWSRPDAVCRYLSRQWRMRRRGGRSCQRRRESCACCRCERRCGGVGRRGWGSCGSGLCPSRELSCLRRGSGRRHGEQGGDRAKLGRVWWLPHQVHDLLRYNERMCSLERFQRRGDHALIRTGGPLHLSAHLEYAVGDLKNGRRRTPLHVCSCEKTFRVRTRRNQQPAEVTWFLSCGSADERRLRRGRFCESMGRDRNECSLRSPSPRLGGESSGESGRSGRWGRRCAGCSRRGGRRGDRGGRYRGARCVRRWRREEVVATRVCSLEEF